MNIRFEWDPDKAASNLRKHGVSFEMAVRAFGDPFSFTAPDRVEGGELRWQTIGMVGEWLLLLVAHTIRANATEARSSGSFRRGGRRPRKGDDMSRKLAETRVDFAAQSPLTPELKAELEALARMRDEDIDLSDLPELGEEFWKKAERGRFYRPLKESTTVRIDRDVLHWLRSKGRGYQTRINAILREAMLRERPKG